MADFSLSDLLSTAGQNTGNFVRDVANDIADNYCGLYRDYPQFLVGAAIDPLTNFRRGLADSLCSPRSPGLPPPPSVPFTGGQCECTQYAVEISVINTSDNALIEQPTELVWGKFGGVVTRFLDAEQTAQAAYLLCRGFVADSPECGEFKEYLWRVYNNNILSYTVVSVTPTLGSDNCGNPPPDYPVVTPPPERRFPSIPSPPNGNNPSFNIPVVFAPISPTLNINVPVNLDLDINFDFDFGGVTFNSGGSGGNGDGSFTPNDRDKLGNAADNAGDAANNSNASKDAANAAKDAANAAKDAAQAAKDSADAAKRNSEPPPPPGSPEVDENDRPDGDTDREGIENLLWVKINLTTLPFENKRVFGEGSPNLYYAGWFEFKANGFPLPRQQINFSPSLFAAPKGVDGYAYCLTSGAEGFATEITRKIEV